MLQNCKSILIKLSKRKRMLSCCLSVLYMLLMLNIWLFYMYFPSPFDKIVHFCFMSFIQITGAAFIYYCILCKYKYKRQHLLLELEGPQNEMNRRFTALGGLGLIVGISKISFDENFDMWNFIIYSSIILFIILQIYYITWEPMIIVPYGTFIPIFGLANILLVNVFSFLIEWIKFKQSYNKLITTEIDDPKDLNFMAFYFFTLITGIQHSSWCFYTILTIWEKMWTEESITDKKRKSENDEKMQFKNVNINFINIPFFNAAPFSFQHLNAMNIV